MIDIKDEIRVWRKITWPFIKKNARADLNRVRWYYLGFIPPALMGNRLERELRRELDKEEKP